MTTVPLSQTWRAARAQRRTVRRRTPLLVALVSWLARTLPSWKKARTGLMQWGAFGALTYGMFTWSLIAGCVATCVSLLVLEALGGER